MLKPCIEIKAINMSKLNAIESNGNMMWTQPQVLLACEGYLVVLLVNNGYVIYFNFPMVIDHSNLGVTSFQGFMFVRNSFREELHAPHLDHLQINFITLDGVSRVKTQLINDVRPINNIIFGQMVSRGEELVWIPYTYRSKICIGVSQCTWLL